MRLQLPFAILPRLASLYSHSPFSAYSTMTSTLPTPQAPNTPTVSGQGEPKIHLYTVGTPNGYKASIALEELRLAYPEKAKNELSYDVIYLSFAKQEQKVRCAT